MSAASETYWNNFSINDKDIERVYAYMLEHNDAARLADLAQVVIAVRAQEEHERLKRLASQAVLYQPKLQLEVGQRLIFSALDDAEGTVTALRASNNPRQTLFQVASVSFADGATREYAGGYDAPHPLNELKPIATGASDESPEEIYARFGARIERALAARLRADKEFVEQSDKWLLRGLLSEVNVGFMNIAEAAIEQNNASMSTPELARVLELDIEGAKREATLFSLEYALYHDDRFSEVGPRDETRWYLNRLTPPEVNAPPRALQFGAAPTGTELLPPELETILSEIQDDNDDDDDARTDQTPGNVNLVLTYPHRRVGSLPFTAGARALFPAADKPTLITLVDEAGAHIPAWLVPDGNYVFGLKTWFDRNKLNVGALLELTPRAEPLTAGIRFQPRREGKSLWVKTAKVENGHLTFGTSPRPVAYKYDDEMLILPEDQNGLDKLGASNYGDRSLDALLTDIFPELVKLGSNSIHAKTLYSAVNFARRVGARAVFHALANSEAFSMTGGGYFVLQMAARPV